MWTVAEAAAANQWPSDCLTMWCAPPAAGGWGPPPDRLSASITHESRRPPPTHPHLHTTHPPLYTQSWPSYILPLERQHHLLPAPSTRIRLDFFFPPSSSCCNAYLKEQQGARRCWIHILEAVEVVGKQGGGGGRGGGARTSTVQPNNCIVGDFW